MIFNPNTEEVSLYNDMSSDEIKRNSLLMSKIEDEILQIKQKSKSKNSRHFIYEILQCLFYFYLLFLYIQVIVLIVYFFMNLIIIS